MNRKIVWMGLAAFAFAPLAALAADREAPAVNGGKVVGVTTFRASQISGMKVQNPEGEDLGKIEDLMIDVESGKVRYAAISFGGFLGLGDKLFAVPMKMMHLKYTASDSHFVLDVDKQRLEKAPGFNKDAWPNMADPKWGSAVDAFYGADAGGNSHDGTVVSTADGKLTMSDDAGQHAHNIGPNVVITLDGKAAKLDDLKKGHAVTVTTAEKDGKQIVTAIAGHSRTASKK